MMWKLGFVLLVVAATHIYARKQNIKAPIPITKRWPGALLQGNITSKVKLEVYLDWACPMCVNSWPHLKQVAAHYGPTKLAIIINPYALPYHRNSRLISQALYTTLQFAPGKVYSFVEHFIADMKKFTNAATFMKSDAEVLLLISDLAYIATSIPRSTFQSNIRLQDATNRKMWKFGARKGVAGTPWYFVNDIDFVAKESMTFTKWKAVLDPLMK